MLLPARDRLGLAKYLLQDPGPGTRGHRRQLGGLAPLVARYGSEAGAVLALGSEPVGGSREILAGEIQWGVVTEGARTLEDLLYRRVRLACFSPRGLRDLLPAIAGHMRLYRNWTEHETQDQIEAVSDRLRRDLEFHPHRDP